MQIFYTFFISFMLIFFSELGDKTQILVLSLSSKHKAFHILLGVAFGTLLSHGLAITFGSQISNLGSFKFILYLKFLTYITFLFFGILGFFKLKNSKSDTLQKENMSKSFIINFLNSLTKNCIFIVTSTIAIGELGDKTFLASIGLGIQYPLYSFSLICGSICGMVTSNSIAIFFGKLIGKKINSNMIDIVSNVIFILFGIIGIVSVFMNL